jgi:prepilin-type N-terminal cleavage/methylation domain-containing protein
LHLTEISVTLQIEFDQEPVLRTQATGDLLIPVIRETVMRSSLPRRRERAFTLIELLVVIAIIALLMALLLPALQKVREAGNKSLCGNNLSMLGLALFNYHESNGSFPYVRSGGGQNRHTWAMLLLPFLDNKPIYDTYQTPITGVSMTDGFNNHTAANAQIAAARQSMIKTFFCPSRRSPAALSPIQTGSTVTGMPSDYAACAGDSSAVPSTGVFRLVNSNHLASGIAIANLTDGPSNTILLGEKHIQAGTLNNAITDGMILSGGESQTYHRRAGASFPLAASDQAVVNFQFGSWHTGTAQFVMGDRSVRSIRVSVPGSTLGLLANISDGLPVPPFD